MAGGAGVEQVQRGEGLVHPHQHLVGGLQVPCAAPDAGRRPVAEDLQSKSPCGGVRGAAQRSISVSLRLR
jgi:hypothetical protein